MMKKKYIVIENNCTQTFMKTDSPEVFTSELGPQNYFGN